MAMHETLAEAPATAKVADAIRGWIREGQLTPRMRVPTEVALCRQTGVSRTTVRSALRALHQSGDILPVVDGRGWEVAGAAPAAASATNRSLVAVASDLPMTGEAVDHHGTGWRFFVLAGMLQGLAEKGYTAAMRPVADMKDDGTPGGPFYPAYLATHEAAADPAIRERLAALRAVGTPVAAQMDTDEPLPFDQVASDHATGAEMLVEWLFARGCRRILPCFPAHALYAGITRPWIELRMRGVERAHARAGLALPPSVPAYGLPLGSPSMERFRMQIDAAYGYLARAFARLPDWDAVMCMTDGESMAVIEALRRMGGRYAGIPVVGYDNYWNECPEFIWSGHRPVATVDKMNLRLGRETVAVLEERRTDPARPESIVRRIRPELRVLES